MGPTLVTISAATQDCVLHNTVCSIYFPPTNYYHPVLSTVCAAAITSATISSTAAAAATSRHSCLPRLSLVRHQTHAFARSDLYPSNFHRIVWGCCSPPVKQCRSLPRTAIVEEMHINQPALPLCGDCWRCWFPRQTHLPQHVEPTLCNVGKPRSWKRCWC